MCCGNIMARAMILNNSVELNRKSSGDEVEIRLIVDCGAAHKNTCCKGSSFSIIKKSKKPIRSSSPFDRVFCKNKIDRNATQN